MFVKNLSRVIYKFMAKLFESAWSAEKVENGVIHNVKILGNISKNKFAYPNETRAKAVSILENAKVNLDHIRKTM